MESMDLVNQATPFLQMGFSFWVAWYSLTKIKPAIENNTKVITMLSAKLDMKEVE